MFELSVHFPFVLGIDRTARFISICSQLQQTHTAQYQLIESGEIVSFHQVDMTSLNLPSTGEIEFKQSDGCNLDPKYGGFDLITVVNTLEYTESPSQTLETVASRLNKNGLLVVASNYDWSHCDREEALGGLKRSGENVDDLDSITTILANYNVKRVGELTDIYAVTRENARSFKVTTLQVSLWQRKI